MLHILDITLIYLDITLFLYEMHTWHEISSAYSTWNMTFSKVSFLVTLLSQLTTARTVTQASHISRHTRMSHLTLQTHFIFHAICAFYISRFKCIACVMWPVHFFQVVPFSAPLEEVSGRFTVPLLEQVFFFCVPTYTFYVYAPFILYIAYICIMLLIWNGRLFQCCPIWHGILHIYIYINICLPFQINMKW